MMHSSFEYGSFDPTRLPLDMYWYFVAVFVLYIGTRNSELIDFADMFEDCNDIQFKNISKEHKSWFTLFVRRNVWDIDRYRLWQLRQNSAKSWCGYRSATTQVWCCCLIVTLVASQIHYRFYHCQTCDLLLILFVRKDRYNPDRLVLDVSMTCWCQG